MQRSSKQRCHHSFSLSFPSLSGNNYTVRLKKVEPVEGKLSSNLCHLCLIRFLLMIWYPCAVIRSTCPRMPLVFQFVGCSDDPSFAPTRMTLRSLWVPPMVSLAQSSACMIENSSSRRERGQDPDESRIYNESIAIYRQSITRLSSTVHYWSGSETHRDW